MVSPYQFTDQS